MMSRNSSASIDSARGWLVVTAAFVCAFVSFGVTYTFGVFLKPIAHEFHASQAAMSMLFSIIAALTFFLAPFTGEIADRHGSRAVVAAGALVMAAALILSARVHSFPLLLLTYGCGLGSGAACVYIPAISDVGEWFKAKRDIALGIAISGIGCGTLVAAPVSALLIRRYGWRDSFVIFGLASGALLLLAAALLSRPPVAAGKAKAAVMHKALTPAFRLLYVSLLFAGVAIYVALVFVPAFAADIGAGRLAGATVIAYIGASSVVGRLGLNALAERFGLFAMYEAAYLILLVSFGLWLTAHSYDRLVLFGLVMGVGYGGIAAMAPAVAANIFGIEGLGELLGILFTGFGVACIIGPPLAGRMIDYSGDYKWPVVVGAAAALLAMLLVLPLGKYMSRAAGRQQAAAA